MASPVASAMTSVVTSVVTSAVASTIASPMSPTTTSSVAPRGLCCGLPRGLLRGLPRGPRYDLCGDLHCDQLQGQVRLVLVPSSLPTPLPGGPGQQPFWLSPAQTPLQRAGAERRLWGAPPAGGERL